MIDSLIPLLQSWLPIWEAYVLDYFALSFVAFTGCFIHYLLRR